MENLTLSQLEDVNGGNPLLLILGAGAFGFGVAYAIDSPGPNISDEDRYKLSAYRLT